MRYREGDGLPKLSPASSAVLRGRAGCCCSSTGAAHFPQLPCRKALKAVTATGILGTRWSLLLGLLSFLLPVEGPGTKAECWS